MIKADLHCHTRFSGQPSEWVLQKLGFPESLTEPVKLYEILRKKGMSHVTVTDHNSIDGALSIAHLENTFISEEVTTYFPEDRCKLHVLVYNIREKHHRDIQRIRGNVYDLVDYLNRRQIFHALAHPLFAINGKLSFDHFEKMLLLFQNFELNGSRNEALNRALIEINSLITPDDLTRLMEKHKITPSFGGLPAKNFIGGSDDHSSLTLGNRFTEVENANRVHDYFQAILRGESRVQGREATPHAFARNLYAIAYQFYKTKLKKNPELGGDVLLSVLDRFLTSDFQRSKPLGMMEKARFFFRRRQKRKAPSTQASFFEHLRHEITTLAAGDPSIRKAAFQNFSDTDAINQAWFELIEKISAKLLARLNTEQLRGLFQANFPSIFQTLGSTGMMYTALAPYILAYSLFRKDVKLSEEIIRKFRNNDPQKETLPPSEKIRVAHFTDTFHDLNGVALTLKRQVQTARKTGKDYTLITCDTGENPEPAGVKHFRPLGTFRMEEYREQKLFYPPFFTMLDYCYREGFTHLHSSTPGPVGLAALGIAKTLDLPLAGTYHTAFPQYMNFFTEDTSMENNLWKAMIWYYRQMDVIFTPSQNTRLELLDRGLSADKIRVYPRGVDTLLFSPSRKSDFYQERFNIFEGSKILYVGRISKEKNLPQLARVYKSLLREIKDVRLIVVGTGPYLETMKRDLAETPAVFSGELRGEELAEAYASADLFVFPSATDTFGNVVLEAQASGLPVIVTDSGGPCENMVHGETGWVVKADNDESLREALLTLLSKPEKLSRMSKAARKYMESRSFENAFDEAWKLYGFSNTEEIISREENKPVMKTAVKEPAEVLSRALQLSDL